MKQRATSHLRRPPMTCSPNCFIYGAALCAALLGRRRATDVLHHSIHPSRSSMASRCASPPSFAQASQGQVLNLRKQEYDIKRRALDALLEQKLLEAEAAQRGMTVAQMQKGSRQQDRRAYRRRGGARSFSHARSRIDASEDVRDQMRSLLKGAKRTAARDSFMSALRQRHTVDVMLDSAPRERGGRPCRLKGSADAPVQIVEFSDFECPFCRRAEPTIQAVLAKYQGKVSLAYRDFPLNAIHPSAQRAAEASRCAAEQGRFWPYHERLFTSESLDAKTLKDHAMTPGLNQATFRAVSRYGAPARCRGPGRATGDAPRRGNWHAGVFHQWHSADRRAAGCSVRKDHRRRACANGPAEDCFALGIQMSARDIARWQRRRSANGPLGRGRYRRQAIDCTPDVRIVSIN